MTEAEVLNFARQTLHELDQSCIDAAEFQCQLPLTMPRADALQRILIHYIANHLHVFPNKET